MVAAAVRTQSHTVSTGTQTDKQIDQVGTEAEGGNPSGWLWDTTFTSYPPDMVIKMPYFEIFSTSIANGTLAAAYQFKVNSIFDPYLTGGGHQPLGRDTWAAIYNYYKVLETRISVIVTSNQILNNQFSRTTDAVATDSTSTGTTIQGTVHGGLLDITANPPSTYTKWREVSQVSANQQERFSNIQKLFPTTRGNSVIKYDMTWKPDMFDTAVLNQSVIDAWTPVGSDPDGLNYFSTLVYNPNSATAYYNIEINVTQLVAFKQVNRTLIHTTN